MTARAWLFVPGDRGERIAKARATSGADALILDLEDSVAESAKPTARKTVAEALAAPREPGDAELWVADQLFVRSFCPERLGGGCFHHAHRDIPAQA